MAKPGTAQPAVNAPNTHTMEVDGKPRTLPLLGPFGDKVLYGSMLAYDYGKADMEKNQDNPPTHPEWFFCYWIPADIAETRKLADGKPDMVRDLICTALKNKARAQSWAENRGGAVTADINVTFNGKTTFTPRVPLTVIDSMRAAGMTVAVVARVKKEKQSK